MAVAPVKVRFQSMGEKEVLAAFDSIEKRAREVANIQVQQAQRAASLAAQASRRAATPHGTGPYRGRSVAQDEARNARLKEQQARRLDKIKERSAVMAGRYAKQAADAEIREAKRVEREVAKLAQQKRRMYSGAFMNAGRSTLRTVGGTAAGLGATVGTYAIGSAVMSAMSLEEQAALLANSASQGGIAPDPNRLMSQARGVATTTGFKAEDVLGAMNTVAARAGGGKGLAAFQQDIEDVAKTAKAAGVSMEDLGGVYAAALNAGVKPGEEMQQLMRDLVQQGKAGAVEFSDLASELARLGGAGRKFGSGADMLRKVSGWAQLAVESKVSPEESRTAVVDMLREFTMREKISGMEQLGVTVTKGNKLNDPGEIMADLIMGIEGGKRFGRGRRKYGGKTDADKLGAYGYMFTGASNDLALGLRETFLKAGGGEAGRKAVLSRIRDAERPGEEYSASARDAEYSRVMDTKKADVDRAVEQFKVEISKLLPEIAKLLPTLSKATASFAKLAVWAGKNPFTALTGVFAAHLTKEIAAAKIGDMINNGMTKSLASNKLSIGNVGAIAMTAAAVYLVGKQIIDEQLDNFEGAQRGVRDATSDAERVLRDGGTDEEKRTALERLKKNRAAANAEGVGVVTGVLGSLGAAVAGDDSLNPEARAAKSDIAAGEMIQRLEASLIGDSEARRAQDAEIAKILSGAATKLESAAGKMDSAAGTGKGSSSRNTPISNR